MKVWSKGLGKIELVLDFEKYWVEAEEQEDGEYFYIKGVITDPVVWDFRITMTKEDIPGLLNIAFNRKIILMFLKNLGEVFRFFAGYLRFSREQKVRQESANHPKT